MNRPSALSSVIIASADDLLVTISLQSTRGHAA
jgi:hypothetical protein